jgi:hypothetical protein
MKLSVEKFESFELLKSGKLAPKNLKPLIAETISVKIKDLRITERADQILLGLSHSKQSIPALLKQTLQRIESNPSDIVGRVSRQVLERAETVRKQLIEKAEATDARWVPEWLKDISFIRKSAEATLAEPQEMSQSAPETAPIEAKMAGVRVAKKKKPTSGDVVGASSKKRSAKAESKAPAKTRPKKA